MARTNKCLAQDNKPDTRAQATKQQSNPSRVNPRRVCAGWRTSHDAARSQIACLADRALGTGVEPTDVVSISPGRDHKCERLNHRSRNHPEMIRPIDRKSRGTSCDIWRLVARLGSRAANSRQSNQWKTLERVKGIEPSSSAWKAVALPLSYTRAGGTVIGRRQFVRLPRG